MVTTDTYEKSISRKNTVLPSEKFPSLVLYRNAIMLQNLTLHVSLFYLSSSRLWKVKNKGKFQILSSEFGRDRLLEVVAYKRLKI